jgi:hypothetical protein
MFHSAPRFRLSTFELGLASTHHFRLGGRQGVIRIKPAFRLYEHAVLLLCECHQVSRLKLERFEDLPRNHNLASLPNAAESLLAWCFFMVSNRSGLTPRSQCKGMPGFVKRPLRCRSFFCK